MSFLLTIAALAAAGFALLALPRLATRQLAVDLPLAWFVGSGWFALAIGALRFGAGVPYTGPVAAGVVLLPVAAWVALKLARRGTVADDVPPATPSPPQAEGGPRWLPRPWWVFAPVAAYVVLVAVATFLQGFGTPTNTDDGIRVRAFTPLLALGDAWSPAARALFSTAGAIPTFVPSLAWRLTGSVDPFHPNYVVLADLLAFLALVIAIPSVRGAPERGWAGAFAVLSLPLFVYHCTTTYQDAVLAMFVAVGFLWTIEYARTGDRADAARALLVLAAALLVKREGRLVAAVAALPLVAHLLWRRRASLPWRSAAVAAAVLVLVLVAIVAAAGPGQALPFLDDALARLRDSGGPDAGQVWRGFGYALLNSGNAGMLYWILPVAIVLRPRLLARGAFSLPLLVCGLVFALVAASSLWLYPRYTLDQGTVHRALIAASVLLSVWTAGVVVEPSPPEPAAVRAGAARKRRAR